MDQCPGPSGVTDQTKGIATDGRVPAFAYLVLNAYSYDSIKLHTCMFSLNIFNTLNPKQFTTRGKSYVFSITVRIATRDLHERSP